MNYKIWTRYEECILKIGVKTTEPVKVRLIVFDAEQKYTQFTNRYMTVEGNKEFVVRMPLSPNHAIISVFNEQNGNLNTGEDSTISVTYIKKAPLEKRMELMDFANHEVTNFVIFAQKFAYNAGVLPCKTYVSPNQLFRIDYLPFIQNRKTGEKLGTPARIGVTSGRIEVSKEAFIRMTIPMRMAILLHEFSHVYVNSDIKDETEADLNGLLIYLSLGYPRIEAYEAFLKTFIGSPTPQNKLRYDIINNFIKNFEKTNVVIE
jgi:hypothetical protein